MKLSELIFTINFWFGRFRVILLNNICWYKFCFM